MITEEDQHVKWLVIIFLAAGTLGRLWSVGLYPPIGGISVHLWVIGVALFLTAFSLAVTYPFTRRVFKLFRDCALVLPILSVSTLLALWATAVYAFTGTLATTRLLTFALGTGLIVAVWFAADSAFRVKLLLGIVVLGAVGSALYGIAVTVFGDPYMTIWVILSKVGLDRIPGIVAGGRMAGLSQNIIAFSYILAAGDTSRICVPCVRHTASYPRANMVLVGRALFRAGANDDRLAAKRNRARRFWARQAGALLQVRFCCLPTWTSGSEWQSSWHSLRPGCS